MRVCAGHSVQIRQIECVRLGPFLEMSGYRSVDPNLDLIKRDEFFPIGFKTLVHWKSCRHVEGGRFILTTTLKFVHVQLTADFSDACPEPVAKTSILVEESNLAPFTVTVDKLGTHHRLRRFKHLLQI